ncbi:MAG: cold shock domain-containing protein [Chloroflexota bacterium]
MNFRDHWTTDENGQKFVFTVEMQRRLTDAGLPVEPSSLKHLSSAQPASRPPRDKSEQKSPASSSESTEKIAEPTSIQIDPFTGKYLGRIKWYNARKKYGFIMRGGGEEIFFHRSSSEHDFEILNEGQWILYDVEETHKGPEATDLEPYEGDIPE